MDIDERIAAAKLLIAKREELDRQIEELFGGKLPDKKLKCGHCQALGHNRATCPELRKPNGSAEPPAAVQ